jgi:hypothetical protein
MLERCRRTAAQISRTAKKVLHFVIPGEAENLSSGYAQEKNERFLASLGMTKM